MSFSISNNTDGLLVGNVEAVVNGVNYSTSAFFLDDISQNISFHGCIGSKCGALWVDGDDAYGTDCTAVRIPFSKLNYEREPECVD